MQNYHTNISGSNKKTIIDRSNLRKSQDIGQNLNQKSQGQLANQIQRAVNGGVGGSRNQNPLQFNNQ